MPLFTFILSTEVNPDTHVDNIYLPYLKELREHNLMKADTVAQARNYLFNRIWNQMYRRVYLGQSNWNIGSRDPQRFRQDMAKWRRDDAENNNGNTTKSAKRFMELFVPYCIPVNASVAFVEALELDRDEPEQTEERTIRRLQVNNAETYSHAANELFKHWKDVVNKHPTWNPHKVGYVNSRLRIAQEQASHIKGERPILCNLNNVSDYQVIVLAHLRSNQFVQLFKQKLRAANPQCILITD